MEPYFLSISKHQRPMDPSLGNAGWEKWRSLADLCQEPTAASWTLPSLFLSSLKLYTASLWPQSVHLPLALMPVLWATFCLQPRLHIPDSASFCLPAHRPFWFTCPQIPSRLPLLAPISPTARGSVKLSRASPSSCSFKNQWNWTPRLPGTYRLELKSMGLSPSSVTFSCVI